MADKKRSGTTRSQAERTRAGRPVVSITLPVSTIEHLADLAERFGMSRSAVVALLVDREWGSIKKK